MAQEIERKFLVKNDEWKDNNAGMYFCQGYLSVEPERTVRIRIAGNRGFLTVKGRSKGSARPEYEYTIPVEDARQMLDRLCLKPLIEKYRYRVQYEGFWWEVDEFLGENEGLKVAEIELTDEAQEFAQPAWLDKEVTDDPRYYNANLINNPYKHWNK